MIMSVLLPFIPPVLLPLLRKFRRRSQHQDSDELFDGDDRLFKDLAREASTYLEYGVGQSTEWVVNNTRAQIVGVDTSQDWINKVTLNLGAAAHGRLRLEHIYVGPLGNWGRPLDYSLRLNFLSYVETPFAIGPAPELVLIDGRFRVASFLTCLARSAPETSIIFDDYTERPHYHLVEEYAQIQETCGRQALFRVPAAIDHKAVLAERNRFLMVLD
jgi:hypothetical protein